MARDDVTRDADDEPATKRFAVVQESVFRATRGDGPALAVYMAIALHADRDGYAWPEQATLAALLGRDVGNIRRSIGRLKVAGLVTVEPRIIGGRKVGNCYRITPERALTRAPVGPTERAPVTPPERASARVPRGRDPLLEKEHLEMNKEKASQPEPHLATVTEMPSDRILDVPSIVDEVFAEWVRANAKTAMTKLTDARRKMIEKRYSKDGYPLDDILDAIRGNAASTWHAEHGFTDLKDAIGDEAKLEKWRDQWRRPKGLRSAGSESDESVNARNIRKRFA